MTKNSWKETGKRWADMSDDESYQDPPGFEKMSAEEWQDYYEEQLLDAYYTLVDGFGSRGFPLFDKMSFPEFAAFAYEKSSKFRCVLD